MEVSIIFCYIIVIHAPVKGSTWGMETGGDECM